MKFAPRSLAGRLMATATLATVVALLLAGAAIYFILGRFVTGQIDQRLDAQIAALVLRGGNAAIAPDGALSAPPFDRPGSGWYWQVNRPDGVVVSRSLAGRQPLAAPAFHAGWRETLGGRPVAADASLPDGQRLHWRILRTVSATGAPFTAMATAPNTAIYATLAEAMIPLALSLVTLGLLLAAAAWAQVRLGLRPLVALTADVADIRSGRITMIDRPQPVEIRPMVDALNALLSESRQALERARRHAANLAHGLKTPLAALSLQLEDYSGAALDRRSMRGEVDVIDRVIRHHMARARTAVGVGAVQASTDCAARLADIAATMAQVHRDRAVRIALDADRGLTVAVETQDFDELFGNLLDNACKWAKAVVSITARSHREGVVIEVTDDGPGIDVDQIEAALHRGRRLDERVKGDGFGLPIAAELTELYGGRLDLLPAPTGGLIARVTLPWHANGARS